MIYQTPITILLVTPNGFMAGQPAESLTGETRWVVLRVDSVGEALKQLRLRRPEVLVVDVSCPLEKCTDYAQALRLVPEARRRSPGLPIVVLGSEQTQAERTARGMGASVYLPLSKEHKGARLRQCIESIYTRAGPTQAHSPPGAIANPVTARDTS